MGKQKEGQVWKWTAYTCWSPPPPSPEVWLLTLPLRWTCRGAGLRELSRWSVDSDQGWGELVGLASVRGVLGPLPSCGHPSISLAALLLWAKPSAECWAFGDEGSPSCPWGADGWWRSHVQTECDQEGIGGDRGPQVKWPSRFTLCSQIWVPILAPPHNLCDLGPVSSPLLVSVNWSVKWGWQGYLTGGCHWRFSGIMLWAA